MKLLIVDGYTFVTPDDPSAENAERKISTDIIDITLAAKKDKFSYPIIGESERGGKVVNGKVEY